MAEQQQQQQHQQQQHVIPQQILHKTEYGITQKAILTFDAWRTYEAIDVKNRSTQQLQKEYNENIKNQPSFLYTINLSSLHCMYK